MATLNVNKQRLDPVNIELYPRGERGSRGISIKDIEQTKLSTESSGINEITVTLDNDERYKFNVTNGEKGEKGERGEKGEKGDTGAKGDTYDDTEIKNAISAINANIKANYYNKADTDTKLDAKANTTDISKIKEEQTTQNENISTNAEEITNLKNENAYLQNVVKQAFTETSANGTGLTINNTIEARMDLKLKGNTRQNGEPTPATPQDIKVVTGDNTINVINKNLLKNQLKSGSLNGITYVVNDNGSITLNGTATNNVILWLTPDIWKYDTSLIVLEPDTYTISFSNNIINGLLLYASYYNKNNEDILGKSQEISTYKILTLTEEVSANYRFQINKDTTLNNVTIYPMIEKGSTKTDYISNKQQSFPISLGSLELCKIGDYQDYIYKSNDKWYKHKVIDKIVLNGDMNWTFFDNKKEIGIKSNSVIQISNALIPVTDSSKNETPLFSSHFVKGTQTIVIKGYNFIGFSKWGNDIYLYLPNDYDSIDTAKKWLNTNKPIVYYAISTPIEEEITDTTLITQLDEISQALSKKGTTIISQNNDDLPFYLDVIALTK